MSGPYRLRRSALPDPHFARFRRRSVRFMASTNATFAAPCVNLWVDDADLTRMASAGGG